MKEKYIKSIIKQLTCSKSRREEIKKQLTADFDDAVSTGEKEEDIISRMGKAEEIAKAFNKEFSDEEKKIYKKERRRKSILDVFVVAILILIAVWWMMPKSTSLEGSKRFDSEAVQTKAEEVIALLDAGDYDGLREMSMEKFAVLINEEEMEHARGLLAEDWGELQNYGSVYLAEVTQRGEHSAVAQMNVSYENTSVTYTISFDEDMKLNGLWMK